MLTTNAGVRQCSGCRAGARRGFDWQDIELLLLGFWPVSLLICSCSFAREETALVWEDCLVQAFQQAGYAFLCSMMECRTQV